MAADEVRLTLDGPIARITLSNPPVRNALTWRMYAQLAQACERIGAADGVRVAVIDGAEGAFAAGTDIAQFTEFASAEDGVAYERRIGAILQQVADLPVPTVAAVDGPAVGGGMAIAALCDLVVATPDSFFSVPVARTLGNCISTALQQRLYASLGRARTLAMLLAAARVSAAEALSAGFVHAVVEPERWHEYLDTLTGQIAGCAPLTLAAVRTSDRRILAGESDAGEHDAGEDLIARCYGSRDFAEGVRAFLEHRRPQWQGR